MLNKGTSPWWSVHSHSQPPAAPPLGWPTSHNSFSPGWSPHWAQSGGQPANLPCCHSNMLENKASSLPYKVISRWQMVSSSIAVVGKLQITSHIQLFGPLSVALPQNTTVLASLFWRSGIKRRLSLKKLALKRNFNHCTVDIWPCWLMSLPTTALACLIFPPQHLSLSILC